MGQRASKHPASPRKPRRGDDPLNVPYQPPPDDEIIVWSQDDRGPVVLAIFDKIVMPSSATQRDTYRVFVQRFGTQVAERAIRLFQRRADD